MAPWVRPEGCKCSSASPARDRCTKKWIRCNERLAFVQDQRLSDAKKLVAIAEKAKKKGNTLWDKRVSPKRSVTKGGG